MGEGARALDVAASPQRRRSYVRFSAEVSRAICRRVASGEAVSVICRDEGMPTCGTVSTWVKTLPVFRRALDRARALGGWPEGGRHAPATRGYCELKARAVFARLCAGETLTAVCADPLMPSSSTVARWRQDVPEFAEAMALARTVQAERFCDKGWEIAEAITPADAYAAHVKLTQLRWMAGMMAPQLFGRFRPVEHEAAARAGEAERERDFTVIIKRFTDPPERGEVNYRLPSGEAEAGG